MVLIFVSLNIKDILHMPFEMYKLVVLYMLYANLYSINSFNFVKLCRAYIDFLILPEKGHRPPSHPL